MRLVQACIPEDGREALAALVEPDRIVHAAPNALAADRLTVQLLVSNEEAEALLDRLEKHFGSREGFRVTLLPVEATLPRLEEPESEEAEADEAEKPKTPERINREELYQEIAAGTRVGRSFVAMTLLSSVVAAIGLFRDDNVVLIGAMVLAPLLTPHMALALAATLGDTDLARRAGLCNLVGGGISVAVSVAIGLAIGVDPASPGVLARSSANAGDILLALASGAAGALAFTTGLPSALIGVMVAVALMPPVVAFGMLLGSGEFAASTGPLMLLATNIICVNLAAILTFVLQGVRPRTWWEAQRARRATWRAGITWALLLVALGLLIWWNESRGFT